MIGDRNDVMIRTGTSERSDAVLYGILRLFTSSKTERKMLKKASRTKKRDARRLKRMTGEKSRTDTLSILGGLAEYLLFGKEEFYREQAAKERRNGYRLSAFLGESPKLDRIVISSEKRARKDERFSGRTAKIAAKEDKKSEKRAARRTKRAYKRVKRYYKR